MKGFSRLLFFFRVGLNEGVRKLYAVGPSRKEHKMGMIEQGTEQHKNRRINPELKLSVEEATQRTPPPP